MDSKELHELADLPRGQQHAIKRITKRKNARQRSYRKHHQLRQGDFHIDRLSKHPYKRDKNIEWGEE
jgi:hypothetical protein